VLFSGGQDSTTCLAWALDRFEQVETISFDYRQRHRIELDQRLVVLREIRRRFPEWTGRLGEAQEPAGRDQSRHGPQLRAADALDVARQAETWALAQQVGGAPLIEILLEHTHTCYRNERGPRNDWGYGCGKCPACALRQRGFQQWRAALS